jgi:palmitoyl-protein thioesterase
VLFAFENDVTVVPKQSAWFGFYDGWRLVPLRESPLYLEDRIGLRELDEGGRLLLESAPGFHMQFTLDWFGRHVVEPYLKVPAGHSGSAAAAAAAAG